MSTFYKALIRPAAFLLDAESAHEMGLKALARWLGSRGARRSAAKRYCVSAFGGLERFGLHFDNPLGLAAGFDKNGAYVEELAALGFGFIEVGTVTLKPQAGNEKPRLFRLPKDKALINRLGFNNEGAAAVARRLKNIERTCVVGINIGRNKDVPNEEAVDNYLQLFEIVYRVADYVTVNVSSPNTPDLRALQSARQLEALLSAIQGRNRMLSRVPVQTNPTSLTQLVDVSGTPSGKPKPLLVKIAPDLSEREIEDIVDICTANHVDGIVATNTTTSREALQTTGAHRLGDGGLSGRPLNKRSNAVIRKIYRYSSGKMPIVGAGGIFSAQDAFDKIAAGASLLPAYTGFVYSGPSFARDVNLGLSKLVGETGSDGLNALVGRDA
jgi:dihydroorotate dehydrogenase